jgi:hypothetical protein
MNEKIKTDEGVLMWEAPDQYSCHKTRMNTETEIHMQASKAIVMTTVL